MGCICPKKNSANSVHEVDGSSTPPYYSSCRERTVGPFDSPISAKYLENKIKWAYIASSTQTPSHVHNSSLITTGMPENWSGWVHIGAKSDILKIKYN